MSFDTDMGPINFIVVTFEGKPVPANGLAKIVELVDQQRILVLDAEFVESAADGTGSIVTPESVGAVTFDGASSGLLDQGDIATIASQLAPGAVALALIYEDLAMLDAIRAWTAEGATIHAEGAVDIDDLVSTLDAVEREEP